MRSATWRRAITVAALGLAGGATWHLRRAADGADEAADDGGQVDLPPARHETADVGFRAMLIAFVGAAVALAGMAGLVAWIYPRSLGDKYIDANTTSYPVPRLQPNPGDDMVRFRAEQLRELDGTYWIDRAHGVVHLPIAVAMQQVARAGISDWPTQPAWANR